MAHLHGATLKPLVKLPRDPAACWEWLGAIDASGYARKRYNGQDMTAARWMWEVLWGAVPEALTVACLHGNRACCNPQHLVARTQAEANRAGVGATLTAPDVAAIKRAKRGRGLHTANQLAAQFDVQPAAIRAIWRGATWSRRGRPGTYKSKEKTAHG